MTLDDLGIKNDMPKGWVKGKGQPKWHEVVYNMWRDMHRRCKDTTRNDFIHYKDSKICESLDYLSNYVKFIESQPTFDEFCSTCDSISWNVDKDIKVKDNKDYYPEFMSLVIKDENLKERASRCGSYQLHSQEAIQKQAKASARTRRKPVIAINVLDNTILLFRCKKDTDILGFNYKIIGACCRGHQNTHGGYRWSYLYVEDANKYNN